MTSQAILEQLEKLARTLINSGLSPNPAQAMKRAREILKVKEPAPVDRALDSAAQLAQLAQPAPKLPRVEELAEVALARDGAEFERDALLKELVDEDALRIYRRKEQ